MKLLRIFLSLCLAASYVPAHAQASTTPGYDVILLVGQSNMVGYGTIPDNSNDAATNARVFMWDANNQVITTAKDPLVQNQAPAYVGMGLTFGKSYIESLAPNRNLLLVGSATGGTSFVSGRWQAPNGDLAKTAVARANAAMAAAGTGARFAGILWHQGESDLGDSGSTYQGYLLDLFSFFRSNITGASNTTPIVVGEWTYTWQTDNLRANNDAASQAEIMQVFHMLPDTLNNTAWVNSGGLVSDLFAGDVHFSAISQRQLGRRYADRFFEASIGLPQPETSEKSWAGEFFDDGRSYNNNIYPVNFLGLPSGTVNVASDPARGDVAQISGGQGYLTYLVPSSTFNGDYTKMAWFKPGAPGYYNALIAGQNPGQNHYFGAYTNTNGTANILAGHAGGTATPLYIDQTVPAPSGEWVNICVVYSASAQTMTLYVNGAFVTSATNVPPAPALSGDAVPLQMGNYLGLAGMGLDGEMTGNRVWTSQLTPQQIAAVYAYELNYRAGW